MGLSSYWNHVSARDVAGLLGTASFAVLASIVPASGQAPPAPQGAPAPAPTVTAAAPPAPVPEQVLITGSLIRGVQSVGVPVETVGSMDFVQTGSLTTTDLLRTIPSVDVDATVTPLLGGGRISFGQNIAIHGFTGSGGDPKTLLLIDGKRWPVQGHGGDTIDPSIIPQIAVERVDILTAGASAVYGADAVSGVVNVILKRDFDGAITQVGASASTDIGGLNLRASQLWGRTWDTGNVTISGEVYHTEPIKGDARSYYTANFEPWGLFDPSPLGYSNPAVVSTGKPKAPPNTPNGFTATNGTRYCTNCFAVPNGAGWDFGTQDPGPTTTWAALQANQFVLFQRNEQNQINPYTYADLAPQKDSSSATVTFDQKLTNDFIGLGPVKLTGTGFWTNRRAILHYPDTANSGNSAEHVSLKEKNGFPVPTTNPYYPEGAPPGLIVNYLFSPDMGGGARINGGEVARRAEFGINFDELPFGWEMDSYYSFTDDSNYAHSTHLINVNNALAALGNTVEPDVGGAGEELGAYTKPANVPYLNVFCDATVYQCNSQRTIDYISGFRDQDESWKIQQIGINFSGPTVDLPGGKLLAAISAEHVSQHYYFNDKDNYHTFENTIIEQAPDNFKRTNWAIFGQLDIPVFGQDFNLPLVQSLDLELGYRIDKYDFLDHLVRTPKVAGNWTLGYGLTIRGAWGKSFRAPAFNEASATAGSRVVGVNQLGGDAQNGFLMECRGYRDVGGGTATPGSVTAILNPTCNTTDPNLFAPAGIQATGGSGIAEPIRGIDLRPGTSKVLNPETAKQYNLGLNFTPAQGFLQGLSVDVSYFDFRLEGTVRADTAGDSNPDDPLARGQFLIIPHPELSIFDPANAEFLAAVKAESGFLRSEFSPDIIPDIKFIHDNANTNLGFNELRGIDFNAHYYWDMGNLGQWNIGAAGYYELDELEQSTPDAPVDSKYTGKDSGNRLQRVRGQLGWTDSTWSATWFVNYKGHSAKTGNLPLPPCYWDAGFGPGDCFPGSPYYPQDGAVFDDSAPSHYTFDLNIQYNTGEQPANSYLRNWNISLTIDDIFNTMPPFQYTSRDRAREIRAYDTRWSDMQRFVTLTLTKTW